MRAASSPREFDIRRRRLLFRSWHRGTRETELIMGRFADAFLHKLSAAELDAYERLLLMADAELMGLIFGVCEAPSDCALLRQLREFSQRAEPC